MSSYDAILLPSIPIGLPSTEYWNCTPYPIPYSYFKKQRKLLISINTPSQRRLKTLTSPQFGARARKRKDAATLSPFSQQLTQLKPNKPHMIPSTQNTVYVYTGPLAIQQTLTTLAKPPTSYPNPRPSPTSTQQQSQQHHEPTLQQTPWEGNQHPKSQSETDPADRRI
ncbi:hypothetical protein BDV39DRAFT_178543 [Aspergillus sergii]|uniref:Uncharacterized protein n=1 Tax=Aspergillus sergii TaxID=1034303 RepID=A0A5N6WZJ7_9EURO|nr:hypothetical protein BDV39DRAFT_178543 [Aspergillus sergii]